MKSKTQCMTLLPLLLMGLLAATRADDTKQSSPEDTGLRTHRVPDMRQDDYHVLTPTFAVANQARFCAWYETFSLSKGKPLRRPRFAFVSIVGPVEGSWQQVRKVNLRFDKTNLELPVLHRYTVAQGHRTEYFDAIIDREAFIQMSRAKQIEYEFGRLKGSVTAEHMLLLRKLADSFSTLSDPENLD
jgi:hypothetical protein